MKLRLALATLLGAGLLLAQAPPPANPGGFGGGRELQRQTGERFTENCSGCHGVAGAGGGRAPNLFDQRLQASRSDEDWFRSISKGIAGGHGAFDPASVFCRNCLNASIFKNSPS